VQPLHVATYIEQLGRERSAPTVKQRLAAIRHLFDWLVTGQVVPLNPAASVRGPSHSVKRGKTPVLDRAEVRALLDSIDVSKPIGLRDRALIGLMVYSFARVGAALSMKVEDVYVQNRRLWVRLHEKGGKRHEMPCHHNLETYLHAYVDACGLDRDPRGPLFRTIGRGTDALTATPLPQANAHAMIRRRAGAADIATKIGNHTFRASGITAYLKNGGTLENRASYSDAYPAGFTPLFHPERLDAPMNTAIPADAISDSRLGRVFVCSMADLYGKWVPDEWIEKVHASCIAHPQWEYLMLTKFPRRYVGLELPPTAWLGTSVDEQKRVRLAEEAFREIKGVRVKWLSLEPLLAPLEFKDLSMFDWVVVGSQSATNQPDSPVGSFAPPFKWVARLTAQAEEAGCRVYQKPNLLGVPNPQSAGMTLIQEEPRLPPRKVR
jgi:site-specific recombinase XerC/protein gp37